MSILLNIRIFHRLIFFDDIKLNIYEHIRITTNKNCSILQDGEIILILI